MPLNKELILNKKQNMFDTSIIQRGVKEGIEIEKGIVLNEEYMIKHIKEIGDIYSLFSAYPDVYLSLITPSDSNFKLFFYQRMTLRALMRYKDVYITAPRAFSKSFITILGLMLQCIFMPGRFLCPLTS